jgi:glucosamine 6-phosphate synthetase-like amidotransferase/phosphosugar isomerase protein
MDRPKKTPSGDGAGKAVRLMADRVVMQQDACGTKATGQQQERAANVQQDSAHSKAVQNVAPGALWEQPRRLKQRRKEYLKAKQLKKKRKGRAPADQDMVRAALHACCAAVAVLLWHMIRTGH